MLRFAPALVLAAALWGGPAHAQLLAGAWVLTPPDSAAGAPGPEAPAAGAATVALQATAPGGFSGRLYSAADVRSAPAYYPVERDLRLRAEPSEGARRIGALPFRQSVRVLETSGGWALVQRGDLRGYVPEAALSNLWIRVSKSLRTLYVYHGAELVRTLPADVSTSDEDKEYRSTLGEQDEYRIPEGVFYVAALNDRSRYYRAFVLNYPNSEDAERGLADGRITRAQYNAIVRAEQTFSRPPMNTALGGLIEIHGSGSGRQRAWTRGCVALRNVHMDDLWEIVHVGTPVVIEP